MKFSLSEIRIIIGALVFAGVFFCFKFIGSDKTVPLTKNEEVATQNIQSNLTPEIQPVENKQEVKDKDANQPDKIININTADIQELASLPGIGDKTAEKIIAYRNSKGKFKDTKDIMNVNGIGEKKYENMKNLITTK